MISRAELAVSRHLRAALNRAPVWADLREIEAFNQALDALDYFIPQVLAEIYPFWKGESLDGIYPHVARKTADREAEIYGLCRIISDQSVTPIHVCLQVSTDAATIPWLECRLGAKKEATLDCWRRGPSMEKQLFALEGRTDQIDWIYKATYGQR